MDGVCHPHLEGRYHGCVTRLMGEGWGAHTMQQADRGRRPSEKPARGEDRGIIIMLGTWKQIFFQTLLLLISCRHMDTKITGTTVSPLVPDSSLPAGERKIMVQVLNAGERKTEKVEVVNPVNLELKCTWTGNENKPQTVTGYWTKEGAEIENSQTSVQLDEGQYILNQKFSILNETNLGNYSCVFENEAKVDFILTAPQIGGMQDKPIIGYVRDYVVLLCKVDEQKPKPDSWNWSRKNGTEKVLISTAAEPHRYEIQNEIKEGKTKLKIKNLTFADSGVYVCGAVYNISTTYSHVELKVITLWEPLKPFIVIVVEVIVLVSVILLYERSRSKKNCAAENGPNLDQTNALTQEENNEQGGSSVRQRRV